jgi:hypothetical protein
VVDSILHPRGVRVKHKLESHTLNLASISSTSGRSDSFPSDRKFSQSRRTCGNIAPALL